MSSHISHPSLIKFSPGQLIVHKKYGYRGVIIEVDDRFSGTEEMYKDTTNDYPSKDQAWYHVLVDGSDYVTYVAESLLELDPSQEPINHPQLTQVFQGFEGGKYLRQLH
ncbi:MAG: heat shock protein HspQ [Bdellovibrionales bacterium]|nr:heat shock protein HspQ [Bdellovibrionales bacterium]